MDTATSSERKQRRLARPTPAQARFAFIILLIINILNYTDRSILAAVQVTIQHDFHLTDVELGLLNSSFLFIYGLATLPIGIWADRGIRKNIVAACVGIWSVATALSGLTHNFIQLFLTRSILGIGEAGYAPASVSLIGDYFNKERRGFMLSVWSVGNLIGTALGLIMGGILAEALGWRWVFYIVGLPGLLAAFFIWRAVEPKRGAFDVEGEDEGDDGAAAAHGSIGGNILQVVRQLSKTPTYWVLVAAFICSFFIIGAALSWIPTFLHREFQLSVARAGTVSGGVLAGGSLVGTLIGGWLADFLQRRLPQGRMIITAVAFLAGAPLTWIAMNMHSLSAFIAVFALAIVCLSLCLGPIQAIIQDITVPNIRSTAVGLALLLGHLLGDAASPLIVGAISDSTNSLGFALQITGPTCLLLAGLICLIGVKTVAGDIQRAHRRVNRRDEESSTR
ncbi:spinster family MFS transporter [Dictyobacter aurantiacus]|uniref:MFS transporter n=1 Tax=Dictyobacter aurantiacus TaxID=1936993 RepID=A0A401ZII5_9CHLR|nr:MFS transporter [Dictyobacter aurantiacus]GCE06644.1 MFS transporter [Dictyobacter aurantiacus]